MFVIRKKSNGNFWNEKYLNDVLVKKTNINVGKITPVYEAVSQTFAIQTPNSSKVTQNPIPVSEIKIIDETAGSAEFTYTDVNALRTKLVAIGYDTTNSGGIGTIPSLAEVLGAGGRAVVIVENIAYTSLSTNKSQLLFFSGNGTDNIGFSLVDGSFSVGDKIVFFSGSEGFNVNVDNSESFINPNSETSFAVPFLSKCELLKIQNGNWLITIIPYVATSGGGLALGETSTTAYRGDRGKAAYDHSQDVTTNPHNVTKSQVGLGNVDNTTDADKPVSTAQQTALDLKANKASWTDIRTTSTITGWASLPPSGVLKTMIHSDEKKIEIICNLTGNQSTTVNTTTFTIVGATIKDSLTGTCHILNNGTFGVGRWQTTAGSNVIQVYSSGGSGTWSVVSGNTRAINFTITLEID